MSNQDISLAPGVKIALGLQALAFVPVISLLIPALYFYAKLFKGLSIGKTSIAKKFVTLILAISFLFLIPISSIFLIVCQDVYAAIEQINRQNDDVDTLVRNNNLALSWTAAASSFFSSLFLVGLLIAEAIRLKKYKTKITKKLLQNLLAQFIKIEKYNTRYNKSLITIIVILLSISLFFLFIALSVLFHASYINNYDEMNHPVRTALILSSVLIGTPFLIMISAISGLICWVVSAYKSMIKEGFSLHTAELGKSLATLITALTVGIMFFSILFIIFSLTYYSTKDEINTTVGMALAAPMSGFALMITIAFPMALTLTWAICETYRSIKDLTYNSRLKIASAITTSIVWVIGFIAEIAIMAALGSLIYNMNDDPSLDISSEGHTSLDQSSNGPDLNKYNS